jgi:xylan 1,4-beta-xylosidase
MKIEILLCALVAGLIRVPGAVQAVELVEQPVRVISADWQKVKGPSSEIFRECIGAGRAAEGLRAEWQRQLKLCQDEIGFKAIRFHGLLHDEMGVYSETKTANRGTTGNTLTSFTIRC